MNVKERLDKEVSQRNSYDEVNSENLDPIIVARRYQNETISLICALFSYGNVKQIVKFLDSLNFSLLTQSDEMIHISLEKHYYRFQKSKDIIALFIALKRLDKESSLEDIFLLGYQKNRSVIDGVNTLIEKIYSLYPHDSKGYRFLLGKPATKTKGAGAFKRWMMFLRWMVRKDNIDMGLWKHVNKKDLIMPLDTHTFHVSKSLGLLTRKSYDLQAALELTHTLSSFDSEDPLKYDFALYRLGQEGLLLKE